MQVIPSFSYVAADRLLSKTSNARILMLGGICCLLSSNSSAALLRFFVPFFFVPFFFGVAFGEVFFFVCLPDIKSSSAIDIWLSTATIGELNIPPRPSRFANICLCNATRFIKNDCCNFPFAFSVDSETADASRLCSASCSRMYSLTSSLQSQSLNCSPDDDRRSLPRSATISN